MNFGWFDDSTPDNEFSRTVIHEFGHALGCVHEHSSPAATISWNRDAVYAYYLATQGWKKADVDIQLFSDWAAATTQFTSFDPASIMEYPVPANLTTNGFTIGWNRVLSDGDKAFIREMYPPRQTDKNLFNTQEIRQWYEPRSQNPGQIVFANPYPQPPSLAIGVNSMDLSENGGIRLNVFVNKLLNDSFRIHLDCWADTILYSAGAAWLEVAAGDPDIQVGQWGTQEHHPWYQSQIATSAHIAFPSPYSTPPKVILWLNEVDMAKDKGWRVNSYASNITTTGFDIHIDTWADTRLYSGTAYWIAYPADKAHITSGTVATGPNPKSLANSGTVTFPNGVFDTPPRVLMAVNEMDFGTGKGLRFRMYTDSVTKSGMTWHIDSWADSVVNSVGASWIALP